MVNPIRLTNKLLVAPQIDVGDLDALSAVGINTIICNRPDGEKAGQPSSEALAAAANERGMSFTFMPVSMKFEHGPDDIATFAQIVEGASGEVLAFCGTGRRSTNMWALSQRGTSDADEIIRVAGQSGFDLSSMREALAAAPPQNQAAAAPSSADGTDAGPARKRGFWSRLFGA